MSPVSVAMLARVGVYTADQLRDLGSLETYAKLKGQGEAVSLPLLWALEAVVSGLPMGDVSPGRRAELLAAVANLTELAGPLGAPGHVVDGIAPHVPVTESERVIPDRTWTNERPE